VYTSGTTGAPKGVVLTQYNMLVDARGIADWQGITGNQRFVAYDEGTAYVSRRRDGQIAARVNRLRSSRGNRYVIEFDCRLTVGTEGRPGVL
jgi:acyl-CoA synthetase (AMP-forming)/AMP-acid ligase II